MWKGGKFSCLQQKHEIKFSVENKVFFNVTTISSPLSFPKARGKPHNSIILSLAFKWNRIVFRCWKMNKSYDESEYLKALKRRGSPLLKFAVNS